MENVDLGPITGKRRLTYFEDLTRVQWTYVFISLYLIGIVLLPPLRIGEKLIFAADWMLLPLILWAVSRTISGQAPAPPRPLIFCWLALLLAYCSGALRGNAAFEISYFQSLTSIEEQKFNAVQDGIRLMRWAVSFSIPWLISGLSPLSQSKDSSSVSKPIAPVDFFLSALKFCIWISALATIADRLGWISLTSIYPFKRPSVWWHGRSYGTFATPLEASIVYALGLVLLFMTDKSRKTWRGKILDSGIGLSFALALSLTQGGTGAICLLLTLGVFIFKKRTKLTQWIFSSAVALSALTLLTLTPSKLISWKLYSLLIRTHIWSSWLHLAWKKPVFFVSGIGFSNLPIDNSPLWLLITGGLVLFCATIYWLRRLTSNLPDQVYYPCLFWILTGSCLDSIGYWGLGRIMWTLLGVWQLQMSWTTLSKEPPPS